MGDQAKGKTIFGRKNSTFLLIDGNVFACGNNKSGQLGTGDTKNRSKPTNITPVIDGEKVEIKNIVTSGDVTFLISTDNQLFAFGRNQFGQLGLKNKNRTLTPTKIEGEFTQVTTSGTSTFFLDKNGQVHACGDNKSGQLGVASNDKEIPIPVKVKTPPGIKIKKIVASNNNAFFIDENGQVYGCGGNPYSELGLSRWASSTTPIKILPDVKIKEIVTSTGATFFIDENGQTYGCGINNAGRIGFPKEQKNIYNPQKILLGTKIKQVIAGRASTFLLSENGDVYGCGGNLYGQLLGTNKEPVYKPKKLPIQDVEQIVAMEHGASILFLTKKGETFACGFNRGGELGVGDEKDKKFLTKVSTKTQIRQALFHEEMRPKNRYVRSLIFIGTDNELYFSGDNDYNFITKKDSQRISTPTTISSFNELIIFTHKHLEKFSALNNLATETEKVYPELGKKEMIGVLGELLPSQDPKDFELFLRFLNNHVEEMYDDPREVLNNIEGVKLVLIDMIQHNPSILIDKKAIKAIKEKIVFGPLLEKMQNIAEHDSRLGKKMKRLLAYNDPLKLSLLLTGKESWDNMIDRANEEIDRENNKIEEINQRRNEKNKEIEKINRLNKENGSTKVIPKQPLIPKKKRIEWNEEEQENIKQRVDVLRDIFSLEKMTLKLHAFAKSLPPQLVRPDPDKIPAISHSDLREKIVISHAVVKAFIKGSIIVAQFAKENPKHQELTYALIKRFNTEIKNRFDPENYMSSIKMIFEMNRVMANICEEAENEFKIIEQLGEKNHLTKKDPALAFTMLDNLNDLLNASIKQKNRPLTEKLLKNATLFLQKETINQRSIVIAEKLLNKALDHKDDELIKKFFEHSLWILQNHKINHTSINFVKNLYNQFWYDETHNEAINASVEKLLSNELDSEISPFELLRMIEELYEIAIKSKNDRLKNLLIEKAKTIPLLYSRMYVPDIHHKEDYDDKINTPDEWVIEANIVYNIIDKFQDEQLKEKLFEQQASEAKKFTLSSIEEYRGYASLAEEFLNKDFIILCKFAFKTKNQKLLEAITTAITKTNFISRECRLIDQSNPQQNLGPEGYQLCPYGKPWRNSYIQFFFDRLDEATKSKENIELAKTFADYICDQVNNIGFTRECYELAKKNENEEIKELLLNRLQKKLKSPLTRAKLLFALFFPKLRKIKKLVKDELSTAKPEEPKVEIKDTTQKLKNIFGTTKTKESAPKPEEEEKPVTNTKIMKPPAKKLLEKKLEKQTEPEDRKIGVRSLQ